MDCPSCAGSPFFIVSYEVLYHRPLPTNRQAAIRLHLFDFFFQYGHDFKEVATMRNEQTGK